MRLGTKAHRYPPKAHRGRTTIRSGRNFARGERFLRARGTRAYVTNAPRQRHGRGEFRQPGSAATYFGGGCRPGWPQGALCPRMARGVGSWERTLPACQGVQHPARKMRALPGHEFHEFHEKDHLMVAPKKFEPASNGTH